MGRPMNKKYWGAQSGGTQTVLVYGDFGTDDGVESCYIVQQRKANRFIVRRESDDLEMIATLNEDDQITAGQIYVLVNKRDGSPLEYARKFTNTRIYTYEGGSYDLIIGAEADDTSDTANIVGLESSSETVDASQSTIDADPEAIPADGESTSTITVTAKDDQGNDITEGGAVVTLSSTAGTLLGSIVDNGDGTYTQELESDEISATALVSGTINGQQLGNTVEVEFGDAPGGPPD